ncbi:MAG: glycosyltransferase family 4 protein [bacterium]
MPSRSGGPLRVVQVSFHADSHRRDGASLLSAWPTLSRVACGAANAGVDVAVVQSAHADETIQRDGVDFHFVDDAHPRRARLVSRVAALAPDVVHVHGFHHARAVRTLTQAVRPAPVLMQDHGAAEPRGWRRAAWRWAFSAVKGVAFTTREQAAPWIESRVLRADLPVFDVLEGSSTFEPGDQSDAQHSTGVFGDPCLLWTSRLDANKDPLTMLHAVEQAIPHLPNARLWCCHGHAPMLDAVRERIASSDALRDRVVLLGTRPHDEMERFHRAADFYLQTSRREAGGFSLLEAMSCGTTPIATDIPPTQRIVGDTGSLTPVGDACAMAAALVAWAGRNRIALRRATRARFEAALTFDAVGRQLRATYESLVQSCAS